FERSSFERKYSVIPWEVNGFDQVRPGPAAKAPPVGPNTYVRADRYGPGGLPRPPRRTRPRRAGWLGAGRRCRQCCSCSPSKAYWSSGRAGTGRPTGLPDRTAGLPTRAPTEVGQFLEHGAEPFPGPVQAAARGHHKAAEDRRDLLGRETFPLGEQQHRVTTRPHTGKPRL